MTKTDISGIKNPQLSHRYRISTQHPNDEVNLTICRNAVDVEIDFVNKKIQASFRENCDGEVAKALWILCGATAGLQSVIVQAMEWTPQSTEMHVNFQMDFPHARIIEHKCRYDYSSSDPVIHCVVWTLNSLEIHPEP